MTERILVTGASGFIGSHCVKEMLNHGYIVRGTVRNMDRADSLKAMWDRHKVNTEHLEFAEASLTDPADWLGAAKDCDGILHVASPVPTIQPKNPEDVIGPARAGTLNVLTAAAQLGIKRIVITSSVAAVLGGISETRLYTADDWSDPNDPELSPYSASKTIAELAAWDFCTTNDLALTTIQPALVLGPALESDYGSSLEALMKLMNREVPLLPRLGFGIVDVRDVATLHRLAYEREDAIGQRLIAANGFLWFREIAAILHAQFPDQGVPRREMPNWLTRIASLFIKEIGSFINDLDLIKELDNTPARALGWEPRSPEEAVISGAKILKDHGLV